MSTPVVPVDPQSERGRELVNGEFADALDDIEEAIKQRRTQREHEAGHDEAA